MHRIPATPGGWNPDSEGVIIIEQNPAPIIFLTSADTDIQTIASSLESLPTDFPDIRVANLLQLQQELTIDTYGEEILSQAQVIILHLLGGRSYWSYGLEVCKDIVSQTNAHLLILPGDDQADVDLISHSNVSLSIVNQFWQYLIQGGVENFVNAFKYLSDSFFHSNFKPNSPRLIDRLGIYKPSQNVGLALPTNFPHKNINFSQDNTNFTLENITSSQENKLSKNKQQIDTAIIFYRSHYLSGNLKPIDALSQALETENLSSIAIYVSSLQEADIQEELIKLLQHHQVKLILNTTSFSVAKIGNETNAKIWQTLDIPVLQIILSGSTKEYWADNFQGLSPRDVAMNVALPEVDGRIITRAISFKSVATWHPQLETDIVEYQPLENRINYIAKLTKKWANLSQLKNSEKKVALILANYPNKDGRIANGVGLDTPASCINILKALQENGYQINNIPANGDELIFKLIEGVTNDLEMQSQRKINQSLSLEEYQNYFQILPLETQKQIINRWGKLDNLETMSFPITEKIPPLTQNEQMSFRAIAKESQSPLMEFNPSQPPLTNGENFIPISGIQLDNIFIGIQPSRGYDFDPSLNYHAPDLEPTHHYLAFYYWVREIFEADAIIHLGKHGNLEWLPGKSLVLSENCYPEITLDTLPNFYPFIVNDPGEGSQAKRRANAVILDHLTPPLTRAELYKELLELEILIDEYYQAQSLNPSRLKIISDRISNLIKQTKLNEDLGINNIDKDSFAQFLTTADGYLCELKEAQIRDGLHIFGQCPQLRQLRDLIISIARFSSYNSLGLIKSIKEDLLQKIVDFIKINKGDKQLLNIQEKLHSKEGKEYIENLASLLIDNLIQEKNMTNLSLNKIESIVYKNNDESWISQLLDKKNYQQLSLGKHTEKSLHWIANNLLPNLRKTDQEITNLMRGLEGKYIPSGSSGAPTRGRADVLPTGRNFYSVDIRAIPSETAWDVGKKAAEAVIERYTQENGEYPKTLAISVWGTSTMRTGGDDIAQIMALMGAKPVWDGISRRVVDYEIIPLSVLGRPRIDVTVRVSGFFRDGFPNLLELLYKTIIHLSTLTEEKEANPLALQIEKDTKYWLDKGLEKDQAKERASYRLFGSKPGAYGAGLQGLIESQNWENDGDLAKAYLNWSSYAYTGSKGVSMPEVFERRLKELQIVLHNQDNREHDLLDSDDYYQFQGGLTTAVRHLKGENPVTYFGDNSQPNNPKVRTLKEEIARVYRSRVINPKWIAGVMRHGYKGAFEMSATVDYLFAYSATTKTVPDFMFEGVAQSYLLDEKVKQFILEKNPWVMRDIAERLIEASQRNLWQNVSQEMFDKLRSIAHESEGKIENL
ncbi:cobaltochelatase subunit CobN [Geminocystis sp. GBBB08]|uniref:cobaltochelatase subunit CobN n=1 Tax=Geminocystis sp. GBBB08 TaxID=2604140 RepID=UPI0027E382F2|nr:cobaltochelatase subunit CobN [Geminocystis sp. GBBB08]MBL1208860.1 cobaltochelatase subunit CobN [Geminocystis sp. GBBB08]